jgi:hypothetical protein
MWVSSLRKQLLFCSDGSSSFWPGLLTRFPPQWQDASSLIRTLGYLVTKSAELQCSVASCRLQRISHCILRPSITIYRPIHVLVPRFDKRVRSGEGSTLSDWFPYLKPIPRARLIHCPDDGGSKHLWNVSKLLPDYTVQPPRRQQSSYSPLWEPAISLDF